MSCWRKTREVPCKLVVPWTDCPKDGTVPGSQKGLVQTHQWGHAHVLLSEKNKS